jgi:hypothetical protein
MTLEAKEVSPFSPEQVLEQGIEQYQSSRCSKSAVWRNWLLKSRFS